MPMMPVRSLKDIAAEIQKEWTPRISGVAKPYVEAMSQLNAMGDMFHLDPATHVVAYFLSAAGSWRGAVARRVKAELQAMLTLHIHSN